MSEPVLIVGGGPAGMTLALALHRRGMPARIVDARPRGAAHHDARILALAYGSRLILEDLGVWDAIPHTPITSIHVSHAEALGRTKIDARDENIPALGYVLAAGDLAAALDRALVVAGVAYAANTPAPAHRDALLTVHAEGRIEPGRQIFSRDYAQHALICMAQPARPHGGIAWERFTPAGPVALLPCRDEYAIVLASPAAASERLLALDDAAFLAMLQARIGTRAMLAGIGPRLGYPLGLRVRNATVGDREVWIGNAAQTLHPVAGQGFNLALRDIAELADALAAAPDPGDASVLARYAARRRLDRYATIAFTDGLVRLFSNDCAPLRHLRGAGLLALDMFAPARSFMARRMMFGARGW